MAEEPQEAQRETPDRDTAKRLEVIRRAAEHRFPTGDIDQMLDEIERARQLRLASD